MHATRYTPTGHVRGVQILIPGVTYDHHYFDLKTSTGIVSQARQAAKDGWVAIALDRLGTGGSSKPRADQVTTATNVAAIDHFADRIDRIYKHAPLVLVGHSYGSVVAEGVAAKSTVVDALVVTGFMYRQTAPSFDGFPTLVAASSDPALAQEKIPAGYLTTSPHSRKFFYSLQHAKKTTYAADEHTKATTTASEVPGFAAELFSATYAKQVRVPVFVVVGQYDFLYKGDDPAAFTSDQKNAFAAAKSVNSRLIANAAHDLALQRNAPTTTALIDRWASAHIGGK
jgi:pimeloyl-ACP methyl ester carboxylesterase